MQQILVIEEDARVATLLTHALQEDGYQTTVAYDGAMGLRLAEAQNFDLVITAIVLPKVNGYDLCREIRRRDVGIPVLMISSLSTVVDKLDGFAAGADDYLTKPFDIRELKARVRVLLRRRHLPAVAAPAATTCGDITIDHTLHEVRRQGTPLALTPREYNLLLYLVENAERVVSRVEIAEKVWHTSFDTGTNFIDVYICYLRRKVDKPFSPPLIYTVPGIGFILRPVPAP